MKTDSCERVNLASKYPKMVEFMEGRLKHYMKTMVPPRNKPVDIRSNPVYWDYTWTNWMDYL